MPFTLKSRQNRWSHLFLLKAGNVDLAQNYAGTLEGGHKVCESSGMVARKETMALRVWGLEITSQAESCLFHLLTVTVDSACCTFLCLSFLICKNEQAQRQKHLTCVWTQWGLWLADAAICDGGDGRFQLMETHLPWDPQLCCRDTPSTQMPRHGCGWVLGGLAPRLKSISFQQASSACCLSLSLLSLTKTLKGDAIINPQNDLEEVPESVCVVRLPLD